MSAPHQTRFLSFTATFCLLSIALLVLPSVSQAAFPGANGKIVFQSSREAGNYDIWVMDADGSGATRLTDDPNEDNNPVFSPDGTKIAYDNYVPFSQSRIYVMDADGGNKQYLADGYEPAWSADGTHIAYTASDHSGIWVMNTDGANKHLLVTGASDAAFSPDGTKIAYVLGGSQLVVANTDGSSPQNITTYPSKASAPVWTPDSSAIVYDDWGDPGLASIKLDGAVRTQLTTNREDEYPAVSPDGSKIVFGSGGRADNYELFTMAIDGSNVTRLTYEFPAYDSMPDWQSAVRQTVPVYFRDPNLEAAVREALGKPDGELTDQEVASLTSLDASGRQIWWLDGLEHATGLVTLNLSDNLITDVTPLLNNPGLGSGDSLDIRLNYLISSPGSSDVENLNTLTRRGVTVTYLYQKQFPLPSISSLSSVAEDQPYEGQISFAQLAPLLRLTIDFGDGTGAVELPFAFNTSASFSHVYQDPGSYTITVTAFWDEASLSNTRAVTVTPAEAQEEPTFAEQLTAALASFDGWVTNGSVTGSGANPEAGSGRLGALRNMLVTAGEMAAHGDYEGARLQLTDAYLRTDGEPRPEDFVTGTSAAELAALILELMEALPSA